MVLCPPLHDQARIIGAGDRPVADLGSEEGVDRQGPEAGLDSFDVEDPLELGGPNVVGATAGHARRPYLSRATEAGQQEDHGEAGR